MEQHDKRMRAIGIAAMTLMLTAQEMGDESYTNEWV